MWYNTQQQMSELSPNSGVFGISSSEVNVVPAGTTFNVMSPHTREQTPQYGEIEERYGIFFFFRDRDVLELPFFAVPHLTLFARDGQGGWFGQSNQGEEEVYYITPVWTVEPRRGGSLLYHTRGGALSGV